MPQLRKIACSRVGHWLARLDGLTLDFCNEDRPIDTILWGDNGSGKTSILHLFFSIFHPYKNDFLGATGDGKRSFDLYFRTNELAFVITEWEELRDPRDPATRQTRIVGRCIQKINDNESRNADYSPGYFFTFIADEDVNLDTLPLTQNVKTGRAVLVRNPNQFRAWFDNQFRDKHELGAKIVRENMREWQEHLASIGFDLDVMELLMHLNHGEGSTEGFLSQFKSEEAFVLFLTRLLVNEEGGLATRELINYHRNDLREEPGLRRKLEYDSQLLGMVTTLAPEAGRLIEAEKAYWKAEKDVEFTLARVLRTLDNEKAREKETRQQLDSLQVSVSDMTAKQKIMRGNQFWLEEEAARLAEAEARRAVEKAKDTLDAEERNEMIARSLLHQEEIKNKEKEIRQLNLEIQSRETSAAPLLATANNAGALYRKLVLGELKTIDSALKEDQDTLQELTRKKNGLEEDRLRATNKKTETQTNLQHLVKQNDAREASLSELYAEELLKPEESALDALKKTTDEAGELEAGREEKQQDCNRALLAENDLSGRKRTAGDTLKQTRADYLTAEKKLAGFDDEYETLSVLPVLVELLRETEMVDPFAPGMRLQCTTNERRLHTDLFRINADIDATKLLLDEIERNRGLLPPSPDVKHVIDLLANEQIPAFPYWHVFDENKSGEEEIADRLRKDPSRYSGVAVYKEEYVDKVAQLVRTSPHLKSPVQVSWYGESDSMEDTGRVVFNPEYLLLCNAAKAALKKKELEADITEYEKIKVHLEKRVSNAAAAIQSLTVFLGKYQPGFRDQLDKEIQAKKQAVAAAEAALELVTEQHAQAKKALTEATEDLEKLSVRLDLVNKRRWRLATHVSKHEEGFEERLTEIQKLADAQGELDKSLRTMETTLEELSKQIVVINERIIVASGSRGIRENTLTGILYTDGDPSAAVITTGATLDIARRHYEAAVRDYDRESNEPALLLMRDKRETLQSDYQSSLAGYQKDFAKITEAEQDGLHLLYPGKTTPDIVSLAAQQAKSARLELAEVTGRSKQAGETFVDTKQRNAHHKKIPTETLPGTTVAAKEMQYEVAAALDSLNEDLIRMKEEVVTTRDTLVRIENDVKMLESHITKEKEVTNSYRGMVDAYPGADDAVRALLADKNLFDERGKVLKEKRETVLQQVDRIKNLIFDDISSADEAITQQFRDKIETLYLECDHVAQGLQNVIAAMEDRIRRFDDNKQDIISQLSSDCRDLIRKFESINEISRLPSIGEFWKRWEAQPFVKFAVTGDVKTEENIRAKLDEYLLHLVRSEKEGLPTPVELVFGALRNIMGKKYQVMTLRPNNKAISLQYYRISAKEGLSSWSGGERLTGAILFCLSMGEVIRQNRYNDSIFRRGGTGLLLLDNPFGTTTYQSFVDIQFALAKQFKVQLIATTNNKDTDILASFPKIIGVKTVGKDSDNNFYVGDATDSCPEIAEAILKRRRREREAT